MEFNFSEEQQMLADTIGRYVDKDYAFEARKQWLKASGNESIDAHWTRFAELGLLALGVPAEYDGLGAGPVENLVVMQALGRGLVLEPYLATAIGATAFIAAAGNDVQKAELLPRIAAGEIRFSLALNEPGARYDWLPRATVAIPEDGGYRLNGAKSVALGGKGDYVIVAACMADEADKVALFCLPIGLPGLDVTEYPNLDGRRSAEIRLNNVRADAAMLLGDPAQGAEVLQAVVDKLIAALCAEAVGAMAQLFDMTVEYLKTRKQFGQPLGSFQALQHRVVELLTLVERSRSMALYAASRADHADPRERQRAVSAAKAFIGRASRRLIRECIQMHGGMGMTDEYAASHYAKRLLCTDLTLGDAAFHTARFAAAGEAAG